MKNIDSNCPVPLEQQPSYEYMELKNQLLFEWTTGSLKNYILKGVKLILIIFFFIGIIQYMTSYTSLDKWSYSDFKNTLIATTLVGMLLLLRIYLGWVYVYARLSKATISYEESGWYDGQTWIKPPEQLLKDKLIAHYTLEPILTRVKVSAILLCLVLFVSLIQT